MQVRTLVTAADLEALRSMSCGQRTITHHRDKAVTEARAFVWTATELAAGDAKGRTCCLLCSNPACHAKRAEGSDKYKACSVCMR